ncbi:MAG: hypothetical protein HY330_05910 [Chloroflexi bacterium]|nr:hypothetical protein [Chloroflexota bacterium]
MRLSLLIPGGLAATLLLAACGGAAPTPTSPPTPTPRPAPTATPRPTPTPTLAPLTFDLEASEFKFDRTSLEVAVGQKVMLNLSNKGRFPHSLYFHGYDAQNRLIASALAAGASQSAELSFDKPGYYPFYCPVPGHENAGMGGMLRVAGPSTGAAALKVRAPRADRPITSRGATTGVAVGVEVIGFELDKANLGSSTNKAGTGHWHVLLDGQYVSATADLYAILQNVAVGSHTVKVELHNNDHSPVSPAVEGSVTFTVNPPPTPTPGAAAPTPASGR